MQCAKKWKSPFCVGLDSAYFFDADFFAVIMHRDVAWRFFCSGGRGGIEHCDHVRTIPVLLALLVSACAYVCTLGVFFLQVQNNVDNRIARHSQNQPYARPTHAR
jgi:hypothetical protein